MEVREALYTTRAMRRMKPDRIPMDVQARVLDAAIRAPSASNTQDWRFVLVDDPDLMRTLGDLVRQGEQRSKETLYAERVAAAALAPDEPANAAFLRMLSSVWYLVDHFAEVPLLLAAFVREGVASDASIYPAMWSAQLAARAEGVGSVMTRVLDVYFHDATCEILGVPLEEHWRMSGAVVMGYPTGRWGVAPRRRVHEVAFRNTWGAPLGFEVAEPLWPERRVESS